MNKTTILSITSVAVIAAGIIIWQVTKSPVAPVTDTNSETEQVAGDTNTPAPSGKKMAFGDFVKQSGAYQCDVDVYADATFSSTVKSVFYIAEQKIRANASMTIADEQVNTSFIVRDGFVYTWSNVLPFGIKTVAHASVNDDPNAAASGAVGWSPDMVGDYNCKPWSVDASLFTVPTNVDFKAY